MVEHQAHAADLLVGQDRRALQRLAQRARGRAHAVLVRGRDHPLCSRGTCRRRSWRRARRRRSGSAPGWRRCSSVDRLLGVAEQLDELEHRLARQDRLPGAAGPPASAGWRREPVAVGGDQLAAALRRPPAARRSGSSGCPAAPSRTAPASSSARSAFCGSVSVRELAGGFARRGKSAAGSVCRLKRLLPALHRQPCPVLERRPRRRPATRAGCRRACARRR